MVTIGVLGMQGAIREHVRMLEALGAQTVVVRSLEDLQAIDGLVLPGGEHGNAAITRSLRSARTTSRDGNVTDVRYMRRHDSSRERSRRV